MKTPLIILLLLTGTLFSQNVPKVTLNDSTELKIKSINIDVQIIGNNAITSYDIRFYNDKDRILEGELSFPLAEGQSVSNFAMEVNGNLREAVVVEKELARVAYETTIRQQIDPGLLEKTQGNNYKARIYPILPNSEKQVIVTYEQELFISKNKLIYELPLGIKEKLEDFFVKINVFDKKNQPSIRDSVLENFLFKENKDGYEAIFKAKEYSPKYPIIIELKNTIEDEKVITDNNYFYIYKAFHQKHKLKSKPKKITLLWDISYSTKNRKLDNEIKLLESYFEYLKNVEVQFVSFRNSIIQNQIFIIENGNWEELKVTLKNSNYDGGTAFNLFSHLEKTDETIILSDGLHNLGDFYPFDKSPVYTINSSVSADHEYLDDVASFTGGSYINLSKIPHNEALEILKIEPFRFLGVSENNNIYEVYPLKHSTVLNHFILTGKFKKNTTVELLFGYRGSVTEIYKVDLGKAVKFGSLNRIWAKQKLKHLNRDKEKNKDEIINLGKKYHLITDYTSLLILDRVEDYARYRIEPPQELKSEYNKLLDTVTEQEKYDLEEIDDRKEELKNSYEAILNWYNKEFPNRISRKERTKNIRLQRNNPASSRNSGQSTDTPQRTNTSATVNTQRLDLSKRIVSGKITDNHGLALPGVIIIIKGSTVGTQTDFDGNFSLNADNGDILEFSYVGFTTTNFTISDIDSVINIVLEEDHNLLQEVIISSYSHQVANAKMVFSNQNIIVQSLSGRASGINIEKNTDEKNSDHSQLLYILNGEVVSQNHINSINKDEIENVEHIQSSNAIKIYGSRASDGMLVITTKEGLEKNKQQIEALENKIQEKIELKPWNPETPYLKILTKELSIEKAYIKYLNIRDEYENIPSFFLDVSDFFYSKNDKDKAITILTNLIEIDLDNYELLRALAYKLEAYGEYSLAVKVFEKILLLRPEDLQSYRDLALAHQEVGNFQKSFDLLFKIYSGELIEKDLEERFHGIEEVAFIELCRLVSLYEKKLKISQKTKKQFHNLPLDLRVTVDWNHNDTDIDLWVIDPNQEKAFYKNPLTKIGGRMSNDMTDGFGPEEFILKKAIKGKYNIFVDYFSDNVQKISGPTILKVTIYKNFGKKNETKRIHTYHLDKEDDELEIGKIKF